jgi:integrase
MRALNKLTAIQAKSLTEVGRHSDGGGLYLAIHKNGGRSWVFMFRHGGKQHEIGIGPARDMPLKRAREIAAGHRALLAEGVAPEGKRHASGSSTTFERAATAYIEDHQSAWRNDKHRQQWVDSMRVHAAPLASMPVDRITTEDVLGVLKPLWSTRMETASRVRGRIERVLDAAKAKGERSGENPARWRGHLDQLLPARQRLERDHHAAMTYSVMPGFLVRLREDTSMAARALEFCILTAARTSEVRFATAAEFDLEAGLWTIPAARMKAGRAHIVPLSDRALELVRDGLKYGEAFVFAGRKPGKPLGKTAMELALERVDSVATVHGFRSTFRDWAGDITHAEHDVIEFALAHGITDQTEAAYRRGTAVQKRRELMSAWAAYCAAPNVIPIRKMMA